MFLKKILKAKWKFFFPKKNKYLIFDGSYNPFTKYISNENLTILYTRGEEFNLAILLICLIKRKFSFFEYSIEFINYVSPKLILTAYDYIINFYLLKSKLGIKTIMLQKGKRSMADRMIKNPKKFFPKDSKSKFHVDYMLVYNNSVKKYFESKINGKIFEIGSFENNFSKINKQKQKKEILFISNYNANERGELENKTENEDLVASEISNLAKKNNIKFNILPRNRKNIKILDLEYKYYKKKINNDFNFLSLGTKSGYQVLNNYKYVFSSYSTMAIEALAKGGRTGFIFCKSSSNPIYGLWFASFEKFPLNGPFWLTSSRINKQKIEKIFNLVVKSSNIKWNKIAKKYSKKLMRYNYQNKIFQSILKKNI